MRTNGRASAYRTAPRAVGLVAVGFVMLGAGASSALASGSAPNASDLSSADSSPLTTSPFSAAFQTGVLGIYQASLNAQSPAPYPLPIPTLVGRDPKDPTLVGLDPTIGGIEAQVRAVAPDLFAGTYYHGKVIRVGLTRDVDTTLAALRAAFPGVEIDAFSAAHSTDQLSAISQRITEVMALPANSAGPIISVGPNEARNVVEVGVTDPASPLAQSIAAEYGSAVDVFKDEPINRLSATATRVATRALGASRSSATTAARRPKPPIPRAPGRDEYVQPMLAGMHIYIRGHGDEGCTAGFMYQEHRFGAEEGVMTAGHCFFGELPAAEWRQGQSPLGLFSRMRDVYGSNADAGSITTKFGGIGGEVRKISNKVFVDKNSTPVTITARKALNTGKPGDRAICMSGAYSGFYCGKIVTGGEGKAYLDKSTGIVTRNVYKAKFDKTIIQGDSGSPVFDPSGVALGILFASQNSNRHIGFYSQIGWVERELSGILPGGGLNLDIRVFTG